MAAPRTGRIGHCLKKVAAADAALPGVQGFRGSGVQGFRGSGVQGFRGSGVQGFRGSGVQGFRGSGVQGFRGSGVQGFRGSEVPLRVLGNPPSGGSSPLRGSFGDFRGRLLGPVGLHVACLPHLHSASGRVGRVCSLPRLGPGRSIGGSNPCFQHG